MRKLHERGARLLPAMLRNAASVEVEIRAGSEALESVDATPGRHDFQQYVVEEAAGTAEVFDWIVAEANLVFPIAGKLQPADGWEIRYGMDDGRTAVFIVRPATGTRAFDPVDQYGVMYRVHTKFDRFES